MDWSWGHSGWGFIAMALFWVAVMALVVWAVRGGGSSERRTADPREILRERFAGGEISEQEYRDRKGVLEESGR